MTLKRRPKSRALRAARARLYELFPLAFPLDDAAIQPLAVTIRDELAAWAAGQHLDERTARRLSRALQQHGCRRTYQATVVAGAMRINLQGEPVEPVTPEGQAHAQQRIEDILAHRARVKAPPVNVLPGPSTAPEPKVEKGKPLAAPVKALPTVIVKKRRTVSLPPK